jgi:hypothetical protein
VTQPYSGAWLRSAYVDPKAAYVPTASAEHGQDQGEGTHAYAHQAPALPEPGSSETFVGMSWLDSVTNMLGTVIDRTSGESHDAPEGPGAHAVNEGAARAGYFSDRAATQFAGETYATVNFDSTPSPGVSNVALRRGMNSLPENNPEGFPLGRAQVNDFAVFRKFAVGQRRHDRRVITPNTATAPSNVPAPDRGNVMTSPYDSLARPFQRIFQRPGLRREPPSASDDLQTEATPQPAYPYLATGVVI